MSPLLTSPNPYATLLLLYFISLASTPTRAFNLEEPWLFSAPVLILTSFCVVGHWRSDEMFHYLHAQAFPLMHTFTQQMITHGSFTLAPGQFVPPAVTPLHNQVPT